ncbi:family 20 glycosylhydrolase [Paenibacillaceae bacterium WGS1546]|uniref:family 20 glycosylhydrolase n=1 Tax=Cohnella sp. WGS1546 TaxID=3366810 RepID=UPI00372D4E2B
MMATLPLVKRLLPFAGESYAPDENAPLILSTAGEPDPRLADAVRALFPARKLREEAATGRIVGKPCYSLQWGTLRDAADESLQLPPQGYRLTLRGTSASLIANDAPGFFYGLQTLRQLLEQGLPREAAAIEDWPDVPFRCMNYDLRQTFSKPELLVDYIGVMASFKANAILIEYEDKFPFRKHRAFRHPKHALTNGQLNRLLEAAERHFIEVIPLQQTFGHLEYLLGREEHKHLRETESSTGELCPSHPQSFALISELLAEIAECHPRSRYLHLGCDEVYSLCECPVCRERYGASRNSAFLDFVNRLIAYTCKLGKKPVIWQDMLAECSDEELGRLDRRVVVMVWHYNGKNVDRLVSPLISRLQSFGIEVMGAPSVRCFDRKDDQNYPVVRERVSNIEQWTDIAAERRLAGLVGTNWSAVFSLGVPYGVFETSWYTAAYFADASWQRDRQSGEPFIDRFLQAFHGLAPETAERLLGVRDDEDYYASMPKLLDAVSRNVETASLIAALIEFETAADRSRTIHKYVYRYRLYPDSEPERRSLENNYRITREGLRRARERIAEALRAFQPEDMAEHYILSRFYLHDFLEEKLYRPIGLRESHTDA